MKMVNLTDLMKLNSRESKQPQLMKMSHEQELGEHLEMVTKVLNVAIVDAVDAVDVEAGEEGEASEAGEVLRSRT